MTISTANFGSVSSLAAELRSIIFPSNQTIFIEYLEQRGYRLDGNLRVAPYDWRLGSSMCMISILTSIETTRNNIEELSRDHQDQNVHKQEY